MTATLRATVLPQPLDLLEPVVVFDCHGTCYDAGTKTLRSGLLLLAENKPSARTDAKPKEVESFLGSPVVAPFPKNDNYNPWSSISINCVSSRLE